jgi:hypothetical protein
VSGAQGPKQKAAINLVEGATGLAQAGLFGKKAQEHMTQTSPELDKAKAQASMIKGLSELEGDKTTADWAKRASQLAIDSGDQATGLKFMMEADKRAKAETKAAAGAQLAEEEQRRKLFSALPSDQQLATIAANPEAAEFFAQVNPEQAAEMSAGAKRSLESKWLKEEKATRDLMSVKTTASNNVTQKQTAQMLGTLGFGGHSHEKWGWLGKDQPKKFDDMAVAFDHQATDIVDTAASKGGGGVRLNKPDLFRRFKEVALEQGVISLDNDGSVNDVDMERTGEVWDSIKAEVTGQQAEQPTQRSPQTSRRVIKFQGN